jgi:iron complex outermembrane receptor protein
MIVSRIALLGCTALAGICAMPAMAQDADTSATAEVLVIGRALNPLMQESETGSRLGLTALETPAAIYTLNGDDIRARGDITVMDAVTRAPGITTNANPGNGGTALTARGFSGQGSVLQLVDGVRLFPVAGTITFPTDPWNLDRIEVLSGPASVLYGQGALGGAVNFVSKQPDLNAMHGEAKASYGSQNTKHLAAGVGGPIGSIFAYRVDASWRDSDGYVDRGRSTSLALTGALLFKPSDALSVTLRHNLGDVKPTKYFGTPLINSQLDTSIRHKNYNVGDATMHFRDNHTTLALDWSPSEAITVSNTASRRTSKRKWRNLETYCWIAPNGDCPNGIGYGTPGKIYRADNYGIIHDQEQLGDQGTVKLSTPIGGTVHNDLVVGFDVNKVKLTYSHQFASDYQEDEVDRYNFNPGLFLDTVGLKPRYVTRTTEYAFFAEDRLKLLEQLSLVGGIRYEHDETKRRNVVYNASGVRTGTVNAFPGGQTSKTFKNTTWRVGAVYQPTPTFSVYGQYSTGVDPLGTLATYTTNATQFVFNNATGDQIEVGAKTSFLDGRGTATLAAYKIVKKNIAAQLVTNGPILQVGERSAKGIEATVSLNLPGGFGIDVNGTVLDAKYDRFVSGNINYAGNTPNGIPETAANASLRWDATRRIQARADLRYVGHMYSDDRNRFRMPSYTVVDTGVSFALTRQIAIDARISNVFDKDYATNAYSDQQWILGRPRSVDVALRGRF